MQHAGLEGQDPASLSTFQSGAFHTAAFMPAGETRRGAATGSVGWTIPPSSNWKTAHDYFLLGVKHIWEGSTMLFVIGLRCWRERRVESPAICGIHDCSFRHPVIIRRSRSRFCSADRSGNCNVDPFPCPWCSPIRESRAALSLLISSLFGLLHDSVCRRTKRSGAAKRCSRLLFFNVGVEAGQLSASACSRVDRCVVNRAPVGRSVPGHAFQGCPRMGVGLPASFWFFRLAFWMR
jgi:hypothetical protein